MEDEDLSAADIAKGVKMAHGHITSISVLRDYRKLGIATKLMRACQNAMATVYGAKYCSLHVRVTNRAALTLYRDVLKYEITSVADQYYADKEDAYDMKLWFDKVARENYMRKGGKVLPIPGAKSAVEEEKKDPSATTSDSTANVAESVAADSHAAAAG